MIRTLGTLNLLLALAVREPLQAQGSAGSLLQRPWADASSLNDEVAGRLKAAADPAAQLEVAGWCERHALFKPMQTLLEQLARSAADPAPARALLRHVKSGERWIPEELARFDEKAAAYQSPLAPLAPARQKELLRLKDQPMKVMGSSGVFDLRSDTSDDAIALYHKVFSRYYVALKRRFPVWVGSKVDVQVFANRADYLRYYRDHVGEGGEHASGFYSNKSVVVYDDPADRPSVVNTARHECTHLVLDLFYERAELPGWMHEGMACYFAGECEQALGTYTAGLFDTIWEQIEAGKTVKFSEVVRRPYDDFTFDDYAASWSWIHFLNAGSHEEGFQYFLADVKKLPRDEKKPEAFEKAVSDLFLDKYPVAQLENEWKEYFRRKFALGSPQQALDFARYLVMEKGCATRKEQERAIDVAMRALAGLPEAKEPEMADGDAELRLAAMLLRLEGLDASLPALRLALRVIRDRLLQLPAGRGDGVKARLAYRALQIVQVKFRGADAAVPFDLRAKLLATSQGAPPADAELLRAILVTCDDLIRIAREAAANDLALDPLLRRSLYTWLDLATDVAPEGLVEIFPRLKLLLEIEPDDRNLAALAVCYLALGDRKWARHLWEDAKARSLHQESLDRFAGYFESK